MAVNRCAARGCGRWTRAGEAYCQRHQIVDERGDDEPDARAGADPAQMSHAAFRARLEGGDYDALLGPGLREMLQQAAAAGLESEIGMLRVAMARLLQEERDPTRMATGVARVAGVSVQAARLRHGASAESDGLHDLLQRGLTDFEADEERQARERHAEREGSGDGGNEGG